MGNSLDIYNTLLRMERINHIDKRKDVLLNFLDTYLYKRDSNDFVKETIGLWQMIL